jgi:hypothetical protein
MSFQYKNLRFGALSENDLEKVKLHIAQSFARRFDGFPGRLDRVLGVVLSGEATSGSLAQTGVPDPQTLNTQVSLILKVPSLGQPVDVLEVRNAAALDSATMVQANEGLEFAFAGQIGVTGADHYTHYCSYKPGGLDPLAEGRKASEKFRARNMSRPTIVLEGATAAATAATAEGLFPEDVAEIAAQVATREGGAAALVWQASAVGAELAARARETQPMDICTMVVKILEERHADHSFIITTASLSAVRSAMAYGSTKVEVAKFAQHCAEAQQATQAQVATLVTEAMILVADDPEEAAENAAKRSIELGNRPRVVGQTAAFAARRKGASPKGAGRAGCKWAGYAAHAKGQPINEVIDVTQQMAEFNGVSRKEKMFCAMQATLLVTLTDPGQPYLENRPGSPFSKSPELLYTTAIQSIVSEMQRIGGKSSDLSCATPKAAREICNSTILRSSQGPKPGPLQVAAIVVEKLRDGGQTRERDIITAAGQTAFYMSTACPGEPQQELCSQVASVSGMAAKAAGGDKGEQVPDAAASALANCMKSNGSDVGNIFDDVYDLMVNTYGTTPSVARKKALQGVASSGNGPLGSALVMTSMMMQLNSSMLEAIMDATSHVAKTECLATENLREAVNVAISVPGELFKNFSSRELSSTWSVQQMFQAKNMTKDEIIEHRVQAAKNAAIFCGKKMDVPANLAAATVAEAVVEVLGTPKPVVVDEFDMSSPSYAVKVAVQTAKAICMDMPHSTIHTLAACAADAAEAAMKIYGGSVFDVAESAADGAASYMQQEGGSDVQLGFRAEAAVDTMRERTFPQPDKDESMLAAVRWTVRKVAESRQKVRNYTAVEVAVAAGTAVVGGGLSPLQSRATAERVVLEMGKANGTAPLTCAVQVAQALEELGAAADFQMKAARNVATKLTIRAESDKAKAAMMAGSGVQFVGPQRIADELHVQQLEEGLVLEVGGRAGE